ncbi:MAG: response regulator [Chloroflexi bacterium]|nr:response regulator [Chloroflexota bacterium]
MNGNPQPVILHIEDNFHNRRLVRKILNANGYTVQEAEDGPTGLQMVYELHPALVLLDISLPLMDGLEIVGRLKVDPSVRHIPVVAVTASAMVGDRERFLAAGCDDYLAKPVHAHELVEKVQYYLQEDAPTQDS